MKKLLIFFSAGCIGALVNSLTVWLFGYLGVNSALGVSISPSLSPQWLYPRLVWGGIWGLCFVLPMLPSKHIAKGTVLSLFPTAVQLFVVFPLKANKGVGGLELGLLTPLLVIFFNWVWGVTSALVIKYGQ